MPTIGGLSNPWGSGDSLGRSGSSVQVQGFRTGGNRLGSLEIINRTGAGQDVLNRALAKVPKEDNSGDADFRFGKASRFTLTTPDQKTNPGMTVTWPPDDPSNDPKDGIVIDDFDYVDRSVEKIKVVNPDDAEQYVIVERILKVMFVDRTTGRYKRFNFDWSKKPSETTDNTGG
ncbi:hypothetical protein [Mesorhizobium opportunistum]|uniref:Uncharacterized protein n=1 Tax=Mesorhizobium opportunistum (strain LMG 24607 / HAMBI 3007 / WSM2075) TaxID=536019 RepID=F7Y0Z2_MESOW|nr:hypothetical protein [Mesorhizobium opportunistum]AEH88205.1 hypothetical protein Mesop_3764 [Mesorhizobium opportunistum WSM2075]